MNIFRVYAKFLPLHVRAVLTSLMKIFLNAPTQYLTSTINRQSHTMCVIDDLLYWFILTTQGDVPHKDNI